MSDIFDWLVIWSVQQGFLVFGFVYEVVSRGVEVFVGVSWSDLVVGGWFTISVSVVFDWRALEAGLDCLFT